jgi:uncharacterized membrane protein
MSENQFTSKLAEKKASLTAPRSKRRFIKPVVLILLFVTVVGVMAFEFTKGDEKKSSSHGVLFAYVPSNGEVSFSLLDFKANVPSYYLYKAEGNVLVRYFISIGEDGEATAALDACASCWKEGKGHRQEANELVCMVCSKSFNLSSLKDETDDCAPIQISAVVKDGSVSVSINDLVAGIKYFEKSELLLGAK